MTERQPSKILTEPLGRPLRIPYGEIPREHQQLASDFPGREILEEIDAPDAKTILSLSKGKKTIDQLAIASLGSEEGEARIAVLNSLPVVDRELMELNYTLTREIDPQTKEIYYGVKPFES